MLSRLGVTTLWLSIAAHAGAAPDLSRYTWQEITPSTSSPAVRRDAVLVLDLSRERLYLFGGRSGGVDLDDAWAFDLTTGQWSELASASPTRPPARFSLVAGIDPQGDRLLVTTGQGTGFFNDVWALDLTTETWTELTPVGTPPRRRYGSAGGTFVGAGALPSALYLSHGFTDSGRFDDTWAFDLATDTWRDVSPTGPRPYPRCLHGSALTEPDRLYLFGGCASGFGPCPLDDLWQWTDSPQAWTDRSAAGGPAARTFPAMAAIDDDAVAVFGGDAGGKRNDLWIYDLSASSWQQVTAQGTPPPARDGHSMVWREPTANSCGALIVFGGNGGGDRNDLWRLTATPDPFDPVIYAVRRGAEVELSWTHDPVASGYEMWRHADGDFVPGDPGATLLPGTVTIIGTAASFTDDDAPTAPQNGYYRLRPLTCP